PAARPERAASGARHQRTGRRSPVPPAADLLGDQPAALAGAGGRATAAAARDPDARAQLRLRTDQRHAAYPPDPPARAYIPGDRIEQADDHAIPYGHRPDSHEGAGQDRL